MKVTRFPGGARRLGRAIREVPGTWRRSLQLRVVTATMLLSVVIALALGWVLNVQIRNGLVETKEKSSLAQADSGMANAQTFLQSSKTDFLKTTATASGSTVGTQQPTLGSGAASSWPTQPVLFDLVSALCNGASPLSYQVLAISNSGVFGPANCYGIKLASIDSSLSHAVTVDNPNQINWAPATLSYDTAGASEPGLVYGKQFSYPDLPKYLVDGQLVIPSIQIYYAFPFHNEQQALAFDDSLIVGVGAVLVLALGGVAWFVTRQVVAPVRNAAGTAERLADGRLDERMRVRGEDDLASLASSFNKMAGSLQNQIRRLEELSRVQRRFVSDVSHELRTPLTTVRMAADVIHDAREQLDAPTARSAELLQTQLDRFEELLADLLEISRFDAGAASLEAEPVDLRNLVHRVVDSNAVLAERRESEVRISEPDTPCIAEIDPRRIERILRNLVVNAIEHSEGRPVVVKVAASADAVAVAIRDYGVGLKPGESSLVFGRFWRADPARARTTGGTGLGLAISLEDARLHHGWLQAWGEPGGGSQFRLTLPKMSGAELLRSPIPLEPEDSRHHRRQAESALRNAAEQHAAGVAAAGRNAGPDLTGLTGRPGSGVRDE